jgi:hypothetical protein
MCAKRKEILIFLISREREMRVARLILDFPPVVLLFDYY